MARKAVIAGAGIGGLVAALTLRRIGFDVEIYEKAKQLGEVGAGVQINPAGMRIMDALGLLKQVQDIGFVPSARHMLVWDTGYLAKRPHVSDDTVALFGFPSTTTHRADFHAILVDAVRAAGVEKIATSCAVTGFEQDEDGVTVSLADGGTVRSDLLVGADGVHSLVRQQLFGRSVAEFTGSVAWRGTFPPERLPPQSRSVDGRTWMGPNGHFVTYPIRRGELINVVGHIDRDDWQVESWTERGTTEEFKGDFAGWHEVVQQMIEAIDIPYKWALFLHPTMQHWSKGRVTLLGDACHPTLPYLAAGANMAIEDGFVLARCLGEPGCDTVTALKRYEAARIPRTTRIVNESAGNRFNFHHPDLADRTKSAAYLDGQGATQQGKRDWLYGYDALTSPI
jgi:salicylate hydroxylase